MKVLFAPQAQQDFLFWKKNDPKKYRKIIRLLKNIQKTPFSGLGKPEPLRFDLTGFWSRRIDREHRLVYRVSEQYIEVAACRYHYD